MSDYARANTGGSTHFGDKDALSTGDSAKVIVGSQFDSEFNAIVTAVATKYDSADLATQAQAEAGTANTVLMTPLRAEQHVQNWAGENDAIVEDLQALDLSADRFLFWDQSATAAVGLPLATNSGLALSATPDLAVDLNDLGTETTIAAGDFIAMVDITDSGSQKITFANLEGTIALANLSDYDANDHIDHTTVTITAGNGLSYSVGGTDISASATIDITDAAASTTNPVDISSGTVSLDVEALTTIEGSGLQPTDTFYVEDAGVSKGIEVQAMGLRPQLIQGTQALAADDMNTIMEFTATSTLTLPKNTTTDLPVGVPVVLNMKHATQVLTITAATDVTLVSIYHPGGGSAASDVLNAGGTAVLYKTATDVWALAGDISDS
jgi:hypothetical protein